MQRHTISARLNERTQTFHHPATLLNRIWKCNGSPLNPGRGPEVTPSQPRACRDRPRPVGLRMPPLSINSRIGDASRVSRTPKLWFWIKWDEW
jgi:hypothetical protein